jgi:hypothetical protein
MGIVAELTSEFEALSTARLPWEKYWRAIAAYVLPQTEGFDRLFSTNATAAITSVVSTPVASAKSKDIYDMTSLWAIDRLTAGILSLKTPEAYTWHDIGIDDDFGYDPTQPEMVALEKLRDYLFRVRGNPASNFWPSQRAAVKSMCAFGDGWLFVPEVHGNSRLAYRYEYIPLPEIYPAVGPDGRPNRMFRMFRRSALQLAAQFGEKIGARLMAMARDPKRGHDTVRVLHAIRPRDPVAQGRVLGVRGGAFESHYALPDDEIHIGESGYYEFPFVRYAWSDTGTKPFSEGPVSFALGEIKSLQELSKLELLAAQAVLKPPLGVAGKNFSKLNFNPGVVNPGLVNPEGKPLFAPLNQGVRPDFANIVTQARRQTLREMLYLNLWQILVNDREVTATEAMLRAQEKGELLGPVGISMNAGLGGLVDREVAVLNRRNAFKSGSPLEMPSSLGQRDISPQFTSPLDRLRRMGELIGMQRLIEFAGLIAKATGDVGIFQRFDLDEMISIAQDVLGAPAVVLRDREEVSKDQQQQESVMNFMRLMEAGRQGGEAAQALGAGAAALGQADQVAQQQPNLRNFAGTVGQLARQGYGQQAA